MSVLSDLLHPLADLHWEECSPLPQGGLYPQCLLLNDKLYVATTHKYSTKDVVHNLHASSADLKSWLPLTVPTELFGIGVYRSQLVLAGGRETATRKVTNKLWVSGDGTVWESTVLPPMPTPRSLTTLASVEDSDCLVVAGGADPHDRIKKVEVLMHGSQWVRVASLPVACCKMQSLVGNGNLYFGLRGDPGREESSIFYCNLKSLLSTAASCFDDSTSPNDSTAIWKKLKSPVMEPSPLLFMNQLIVTGGVKRKSEPCSWQNHLIYTYSPTTQEWVQVGDLPYSMSYPATVALSTGELVVVGEENGVRQWKTLKASIKISPYKPSNLFSMSALSRLEDAGFDTLTTLASIRQKFSEQVGVSLDQRAQAEYEASDAGACVEIIIRQWLCGSGSLPPNWQALFGVLRQLSLEELSYDTELYLSSVKCLKDICHCAILCALLQHGTLESDQLNYRLPLYLPPTTKHSIIHTVKAHTQQLIQGGTHNSSCDVQLTTSYPQPSFMRTHTNVQHSQGTHTNTPSSVNWHTHSSSCDVYDSCLYIMSSVVKAHSANIVL